MFGTSSSLSRMANLSIISMITVSQVCTGKHCLRSKYNDRGQYCQIQTEKTVVIYVLPKSRSKKMQHHSAMASLCWRAASHCYGCVAFKDFVCEYFISKDM